MRKVIAFVVLGALVSALLSSPAHALNFDPKNPGPGQVVSRAVSGDDGGWDDPAISPQVIELKHQPLRVHIVGGAPSGFGSLLFWLIASFDTQTNELDSTNGETVKRDTRANTD